MSLTIKTNLSSLIAQNSLKTSTNKLNTAIERMSTGAKINHAKDNAANYSIATNMTTKINALQVAEDNCASGLDLISTASGSLDLISDKLSRLRALATQAQNGTYGNKSLSAINAEATALINEIYRTKNTTTYNGQKIYGNSYADEQTAGAKGLEVNAEGFLQDVTSTTSAISTYGASGVTTALADVDESQTLAVGTYSISTAEELAKLATMQNSDKVEAGSTFVLTADIDLSAYSSGEGWVPIGGNGNYSNKFSGTFDGQGHKITNLYINRSSSSLQGLFGAAQNAEFKNVTVEGESINGETNVGGLVGWLNTVTIINCNTSVDITVTDGHAGGLVGWGDNLVIDYCYSKGNVYSSGENQCGGLLGIMNDSDISNCFATGNVCTEQHAAGGLIGQINNGSIVNCFATGNATALTAAAGLVGWCSADVINCHSTGNITSTLATDSNSGGLIGLIFTETILANCYSTGDVNANGKFVGGLVGYIKATVNATNCYSTGNVTGANYTGGLVGSINATVNATNCYSTGNVTGANYTGGLVGGAAIAIDLENCYSTGNVTGTNYVGGFAGYAYTTINATNCYSRGNLSGTGKYVGGFLGYSSNSSSKFSNCAVLSTSESAKGVLAGYANGKFENCTYASSYEAQGLNLIASGNATVENAKLRNVTPYTFHENNVGLQVGINSNESSRIEFESAFSLGNLRNIIYTGIEKDGTLELLDSLISQVSEQQTKYGAIQNRLESALDEIATQYDNLVSSRSTIKDADIAEVSSDFIKQQILQEASATLMATANQTPALALQLL